MPTKTIYLSDSDMAVWDEAVALAKRSRTSISKMVVSSLETLVIERRGVTGLPLGFKVPASMKDPKALEREQLADDVRARVLEYLEVASGDRVLS